MQELFRFFAVRAPAQLGGSEHVPLKTETAFQKTIERGGLSPARVEAAANARLGQVAGDVLRELDQRTGTFASFRERVLAGPNDESSAPVAEWVRQDFQAPLADVAAMLGPTTEQLKDSIAALRLLRLVQKRAPAPVSCERVTESRSHGGSSSGAAERLVGHVGKMLRDVRVRQAIQRASVGSISYRDLKKMLDAPVTYDPIDQVNALDDEGEASEPSELEKNRKILADLTQLIRAVRATFPGKLFVDGANEVLIETNLRNKISSTFAEVIDALMDTPGLEVPKGLGLPFVLLHTTLEDKARYLQNLIDKQAPAAGGAQATPASPSVAGHMQLAGVADVHVVLAHVKRYERAEIAHIENVLQGETRTRKYRTLLRNDTENEKTTETTTTQEREVKTESKSNLKLETNEALKEVLEVKAGADFEYNQGKTLTLKLNASVGYTRTKEESSKVASEFAKEVTNRAVEKIVETVKNSVKVKILNETEETIEHTFVNTPASASDHVTGIYQWVEKVYENVQLTVGAPAAIFDGVVLQPARRLLSASPSSDGALKGAAPPPPLDFSPADIESWNYLSLAGKFGATSMPAPPFFSATASFSSAGGAKGNQALAQDIALPDDTAAAYAVVSLEAEDDENDTPNQAGAVASLAGRALVVKDVDDDAVHEKKTALSGERGLLPFAALFWDTIGYECTAVITCIRSREAYEAWQLAVYAALISARAQAQQAYDEKQARDTLQQSYDLGPSPGRAAQLIREEIKRCAIGVLARKVSGKNIYERLGDFYAAGQTDEVARLCLLFEHAFAWEHMSYVLYPYYWADPNNQGWALHTSRSENSDEWADFLRAGAARVVVPVREGFVKQSSLDAVSDASATGDLAAVLSALQLLQEDVTPILDGTTSLDDLLSISSSKAIAAAKESALRAQVMDKWEEQTRWLLRAPTELVLLRPRTEPALPRWEWNASVDFTKGIADAWLEKTTP